MNIAKYFALIIMSFFLMAVYMQLEKEKYSIEINGHQTESYSNKAVNRIKLNFLSSNDTNIEILLSAKDSPPDVNSFGRKHSYNCDSKLHCTISLSYNDAFSLEIISNSEPFVIKDIIILSEKNSSENFIDIVKEFFILFLLIYPIYLFLHFNKFKALSEWIILVLSFYLLIKLQPVFFAACLSYAFFAYKYRNSTSPLKSPFFIFIGSILLFVFFKYFYKYFNFNIFYGSTISIFIPIGMSYFIFKLIDSQLMWHRGPDDKTTFREYLLFLFIPTTLPAGPIDSLRNFFNNRVDRISRSDFSVGLNRLFLGIFQKIFISDYLIKNYINSYISHPLQDMSGTALLLYLPLIFIYIYVDFSAYSNIAIGLSRLLGFKIAENFNWPIFAVTPQEFWKKWHMSLSSWSLRNIYFPILVESKSRFLSIFLVMLVIGMWHDVSLSWFFWSIHHVVGISISALILRLNPFENGFISLIFSIPQRIFTFLFISSGYAFASTNDFNTALKLYISFWTSIQQLLLNII